MDAAPVEKYLDENAERFDPTTGASCVAGSAEFRTKLELLAREQGFLRIGFAAAEPFLEAGQRFKEWLDQGHAGTMSYLAEFGDRHVPGRLLANARSIVVAAAALATPTCSPPSNPSGPHGQIANYALGLDYHIALRSRLRRIGQGLADLSGRPVWTRACIDTAPLLEREAARRAGIGFIGKSAMLIVPGVGPRVLLASMVTDLAPPWEDEPIDSRCGRCTACLDECPTQAFVSPFRLDARRCISYLGIEHRGEIPRPERPGFGNRLVGCDICQSVCPYDRPESAPVVPADAAPRALLVAPDLIRWLEMSSSDYRRITRRTALRRLGRFELMRNAAVALGNSGDARAIEPLIRALTQHPNPLVRSHAAWALGRLGGSRALAALVATRERECEQSVLLEVEAALELHSPGRSDEGKQLTQKPSTGIRLEEGVLAEK